VKKTLAMALAALFMLGSTSSCIGRMGLSGSVMKWNLSVAESKWGREAVFLVLYIIPVYPFSGMLDLLIFNSIEFHSGTNPISGQPRLARIEGSDGSVASVSPREDGSIDLEVVSAEGERHFVNLIRDGDHALARDDSLEPIARMNDAGEVVLLEGVDTR